MTEPVDANAKSTGLLISALVREHNKAMQRLTASRPAEPACSTCRDTGKVECAEPDGSGLYDQACPDCDAPYPVTGDPSAEDPFAAPASPSQTTPRGTEK